MTDIKDNSQSILDFDIPPIDTALTNGYYLHSTLRGYESVTQENSIESEKIKSQLGILRGKIKEMKEVEQQFYDMFEVKNAKEFSDTYLIEMKSELPDNATISQKILSVFNSPEVFNLLTTPIQDRELDKDMDKAADAFFNELESTGAVYELGEAKGVEALKGLLNELAKQNREGKIDSSSLKFKVPERTITSNKSKYIISILTQLNPELEQRIKGDLKPRINAIMNYARTKLGHEDWYPLYEKEIYMHLMNTAGLIKREEKGFLDEKNLGMFFNYQGAKGGIYEIALAVSLRTPDQIKAQQNFNQLQANDIVKAIRQKYDLNADEHVQIIKNKKGENSILRYKSPTDLIISNGVNSFNIQIKNTETTISEASVLKLQNTIRTSTFLANVEPVLGDDQTLNLFIYHLVNQSLWGEYKDNSNIKSGYDYMLKVLQICVEYYVESQYVKRLNQVLESNTTSQLGNAFFIYAGHLIPISAFIEFAINAIEKPMVFFGPNTPQILYGYRSKHELVRGQPYEVHTREGYQIYESSKISEISIAIGQLLDTLDTFNAIAALEK